jgi:hypothetical protein
LAKLKKYLINLKGNYLTTTEIPFFLISSKSTLIIIIGDKNMSTISIFDATGFVNRVVSNLNSSTRSEGVDLEALVASPMEEMLKLGEEYTNQSPRDSTNWQEVFNNADPELLGEYLEMIKADARHAEEVMARGLTSRAESNYWRCVACRWGLGLFLIVVGALVTYFTAGSAAPIVAWLMKTFSLTVLAAQAIVTGVVGAGVFTLSYITSFICSQIPNTCGAPAASWSFLIDGLSDTDSVSIYDAAIYGTGNNGIDAWGWGTGGPNLTGEVNGRKITLTSEVKPGNVDPLFAMIIRYQVTNAAGVSTNLVLSEMIKSN